MPDNVVPLTIRENRPEVTWTDSSEHYHVGLRRPMGGIMRTRWLLKAESEFVAETMWHVLNEMSDEELEKLWLSVNFDA